MTTAWRAAARAAADLAAKGAAEPSALALGADLSFSPAFALTAALGLMLRLEFAASEPPSPVFFFPFGGTAVLLIGTKLSVFLNNSWSRGSVYALDPA